MSEYRYLDQKIGTALKDVWSGVVMGFWVGLFVVIALSLCKLLAQSCGIWP